MKTRADRLKNLLANYGIKVSRGSKTNTPGAETVEESIIAAVENAGADDIADKWKVISRDGEYFLRHGPDQQDEKILFLVTESGARKLK